ncbi:MAG: hypothetical protein Ct9H90mP2_13060 [Dehalococcoidia bacterium]|nr:MAG: hypothetical protein Ct9H90mP2_13060 [Dehalococcoidia bacterium]
MDAIYPYARDHLHFPEQINKEIQPYKVKKVTFFGAAMNQMFVLM